MNELATVCLATYCQHRALGFCNYLGGDRPRQMLGHCAVARFFHSHYDQIHIPFLGEGQNALSGELEARHEFRFTPVRSLSRHQKPHRFPRTGFVGLPILGGSHRHQLQEDQIGLILFRQRKRVRKSFQ